MARYTLLFVLAIAILVLLIFLAGQAGFLHGRTPAGLGVHEGKLKRPSKTPNSASSQADLWPDHPMQDYARIAPFKTTGDGSADMLKIVEILKTMPRTVIVQQNSDYLYAQCTTALLKFTDDVEFHVDKTAGVIHVRSASRLGHGDRGVNRERIEQIRSALGQ
jgi:uncharacterized protein (DUF1499 family)